MLANNPDIAIVPATAVLYVLNSFREDTLKHIDTAKTAAVLLIGNELLSGRTQDSNLAYIAARMQEKGIRVMQARVIPDQRSTIVNAINELRQAHDYVFTTGGIGPTHDDITADCVAEAFAVDLPIHAEAQQLLLDYFRQRGIEANDDRMRMARIPEGATLIDNPVSIAPGFKMQNVFVMAGVPRIMQAMLDGILPQLVSGAVALSKTVICDLGEGTVAADLRALQELHSRVDIGSYPGRADDKSRLSLVVTSTNSALLEQVSGAVEQMVRRLGGQVFTEHSG